MARKKPLTVIYDGSCPVCRHEIDTYRRVAKASGVAMDWCDISRRDMPQAARGMSVDEAARRLHVLDSGRLFAGVDAFEVIWSQLPALRPLARLLQWPVVRPVAHLVYEGVLAPALYRLNRNRRERAQAARRQRSDSKGA
jgi:predicted DCC family thiol-disulfide oxidoreductase YuxK